MSTPPKIIVGTHFHARHDSKTTLVFLPADGEASWSQLQNSLLTLRQHSAIGKTPMPVSSR